MDAFHKCRIILVILILLITTASTHSQHLANSRKSSYFTYIYKINSQEAKELLHHNYINFPPNNYYHTLIDSFPTDSTYNKKLDIGHYLWLLAKANKLETEVVSVNSFDIKVFNNDRDIVLFLHKKDNDLPIKNATIRMGKTKIPFNPVTGTYELLNSSRRGYLTISVGEETAYLKLVDKYQNYNSRYWNNRRRAHYSSHKGYLTFSKPKYLPNDTLRWKAFVTNKRGKPYKKPVLLSITKNNKWGEEIYSKEIENITDGAYLGELVLGDSLTLNNKYLVSLLNPRNKRVIMSNNFYLEDYQLDEVSYSLRLGKEEYHNGDPMDIYLQGTDANGLNVFDSRVDIEVSVVRINRILGDSLFIPNLIWEKDISLDQYGATKVIIPQESLPFADLELKIKAVFNNSNNETHEIIESIDYFGHKARIESYLFIDSIQANYKNNGQIERNKGKVYGIANSDTLLNDSIIYPSKLKLNPSFSHYIFECENDTEELNVKNHDSFFNCKANRKGDSIFIKFSNPRRLNIYYNIFQKKNTLVKKGISIDLDTVIHAENRDSYTITCSYNWAGEIINSDYSVLMYKDRLTVDIDQPSRIFPGQNVDITIRVRDIDENPVENVNICAGSINAQFDEDGIVDVPYLGKEPDRRGSMVDYYIKQLSYNGKKKISSDWFSRFSLDSIPYYRIINPENGLEALYDSNTVIFGTQFSPYVFEDGYRKDVYLIFVDDKLIYYSGNENRNKYSFLVRHGYHNVKLRTENKEVIIDSVFFKHGQKLELSVCIDSVMSNVIVKKRDSKITEDESSALVSNMFDLKNNFEGTPIFLKQKNNVISISKSSRNRYYTNWVYNLGPFKRDSIEFVATNLFTTKFLFVPGYEYTVDKGLIKMVKVDNYEPGDQLENNDEQLLGEILVPIEVKYNLKTPIWDRYICMSNQRTTKPGMGTFRFDYIGDKEIGITRMIKKNSIPMDTYYNGGDRIIFNLTPGYYQLLIVTDDLEFYSIDSINIQKNGTSYYRFSDDNLKLENPSFDIEDYVPTAKSKTKTNINDYHYIDYYGNSAIKGTVVDMDTGEPVPFANIVLEVDGTQVGGATSDFDGNYTIMPIESGYYDMKITFVGYKTKVIEDVRIKSGRVLYYNVQLESTAETLDAVEIIDYRVPLISKDRTSSGTTVTSNEIRKMPNRSANGVAATVGGVYYQGGGNIRGARSDVTATYIDGMRIIGNSDNTNRSKYVYGEYSKVEEVLLGSNKIRSNFVDYAYWQPNLITDENGEVSFNVTFPDNITSWRSYALAMGLNRKTGSAITETDSYINLMGQVSTPRFLVIGDSTNVVSKVINYDKESKQVTEEFRVNDSLISKVDTIVETSIVKKIPVIPLDLDTMDVSLKVSTLTGFTDGEERSIPVIPRGVMETVGSFYTLSGDTTITLASDTNDYIINIENDALMPLLDEINKLEKYPYFCMEQSSSKLIGMLMKKRIQEALGKEFKDDNNIRSLIRRIKKGRKEDGSWGWWYGSKSNVWMTSYVLRALYMAKEYGYKVPDLEKGTDYLKWHLELLKGTDLLYALSTLSEMGVDLSYNSHIRKLEKQKLSMYDYFQTIRIKQLTGLEYSIDSITKSVKSTYFGNYYWGNSTYGWYSNINSLSILAYKIIEENDSLHPFLPHIRNYFLEIKGENRWHNTIDKAQILSTILPGMLAEYDGKFKPVSIVLSGSKNSFITEFPYQTSISDKTNELEINKTGIGNVYITKYWEYWNLNPVRKDSLFEVNSWFEKDGIRLDSLEAGVEVDMKIRVRSKSKGKYIMIEVPIPAGCSYGDNKYIENGIEDHREYFKNKTSIFCSYFGSAEYEFTIKLQPRYTGRYTLNPAKVELMYFPVYYGRNEVKQTIIN